MDFGYDGEIDVMEEIMMMMVMMDTMGEMNEIDELGDDVWCLMILSQISLMYLPPFVCCAYVPWERYGSMELQWVIASRIRCIWLLVDHFGVDVVFDE